MPQNWICIVNRANFEIILKHKIWGVSEKFRYRLNNTKVGDNLIFYITKEKVLAGIFNVSKAPYKETKKIFEGGTYPFRIGVEKAFMPNKPISFSKELRANVTFIKNKRKWQLHFYRAMVSISDQDFQILEKAMKKSK